MLAERGACVVAAVRDRERSAAVLDAIQGDVQALTLDVSSLASVRAAARTFRERHPTLDVLVNNAGVLVSKPRRCSIDGHELTWATNLLGPFALTQELLPALLAADAPRVVNVGSTAYRYGRMMWDDLEFERGRFSGGRAYANSKLALLLFTRELARRQPRIAANCVHPGGIATDIYREVPAIARAVIMRILPPPARGALPVVRLAAAPEMSDVSAHYFDGMKPKEASAAGKSDADAARLWEILTAQAAL